MTGKKGETECYLLMVNGDNKRKQIYKITFPILIRLFQKQTNKSNSEN